LSPLNNCDCHAGRRPFHPAVPCDAGWLLAGVADWACHRRTGLERTTGVKESLLHLLMIAQVGLGVLAVLFLEINRPCCCCWRPCWLRMP
jgi:hypothetical protein